jgi:molybdopterin-synthase adenylyltransferase
MDLDFSEDEIRRYSRHILLGEVGGTGQAKLKAARVLVVGAGGLGSPLVLYLAAAGVGTIGIVDDDVVELSNLQRQIAHTTARIGTSKVESAAMSARAINPEVRIEPHALRLNADNAMPLIERYDLVCDGTDNFATRFLVADACVLARRTLVSAAVLRFEGQLSVFKAHVPEPQDGGPQDGGPQDGGPHAGAPQGDGSPGGGPCYRCLYGEAPPDGAVPTCSEAGVLGAVTGVMGTLQATEVLKEILGVGESLSGRLLIWDALASRFRTVRLRPDPLCALCGPEATIKDLSAHRAGVASAGAAGAGTAPACAV